MPSSPICTITWCSRVPNAIVSGRSSESMPSLIHGMSTSGVSGRVAENVMAGTDCGFAQSPFAQRVHPTIMWAKLKAMVEGAKIATKVLWKKRKAG